MQSPRFNSRLTLISFPSSEVVSNANSSAFRSLHMQQSDSSSSEELSVSGKTKISYQLSPGKLFNCAWLVYLLKWLVEQTIEIYNLV